MKRLLLFAAATLLYGNCNADDYITISPEEPPEEETRIEESIPLHRGYDESEQLEMTTNEAHEKEADVVEEEPPPSENSEIEEIWQIPAETLKKEIIFEKSPPITKPIEIKRYTEPHPYLFTGEEAHYEKGTACDDAEGKKKHSSCWCEAAEVELSLSYSSKYIWRGLNFTDGPVLQPDLTVQKCGVNIEVWGNMDLTSANGQDWDFTEIDIILGYSGNFSLCKEKISYSFGTINYLFPTSEDPQTWEIFLALNMETFLTPTLTFYYDFDQVKGWYGTFSVNHEWKELFCLCKELKIGGEIAALIGWGSANFNDLYYAYNGCAFANLLVTLSLPMHWKCWKIAPFFSGSTLVDKRLRDRIYPHTNYWGGIALERRF